MQQDVQGRACSELAAITVASESPLQVKQYFAAITGRRNSITGLLYRDDPTIMSWASGWPWADKQATGFACGALLHGHSRRHMSCQAVPHDVFQ